MKTHFQNKQTVINSRVKSSDLNDKIETTPYKSL